LGFLGRLLDVFVNLVGGAYRLKSVEELVMTEERQRAEGRRQKEKENNLCHQG